MNEPNRWKTTRAAYGKLRRIDQARLPPTQMGGVPTRNGKYGMTVAEYLHWQARKANRVGAFTDVQFELSIVPPKDSDNAM